MVDCFIEQIKLYQTNNFVKILAEMFGKHPGVFTVLIHVLYISFSLSIPPII